MSGENKFFFEEDSEASSDATINAKDQADIFGAIVAEAGVSSNLESMAPLEMVAGKNELKTINTTIVTVEYGIVQDNYTVHITPTHKQRNLSRQSKFSEALEATIILMNTKVPFDLRVEIIPPQEDWEVKMLSFIIQGGATAWNFDIADFEATVIPKILEKITAICMVI